MTIIWADHRCCEATVCCMVHVVGMPYAPVLLCHCGASSVSLAGLLARVVFNSFHVWKVPL